MLIVDFIILLVAMYVIVLFSFFYHIGNNVYYIIHFLHTQNIFCWILIFPALCKQSECNLFWIEEGAQL